MKVRVKKEIKALSKDGTVLSKDTEGYVIALEKNIPVRDSIINFTSDSDSWNYLVKFPNIEVECMVDKTQIDIL